jgi:hypothetical protein
MVYFFKVSYLTSFPITNGEITHKNNIRQYKSGFIINLYIIAAHNAIIYKIKLPTKTYPKTALLLGFLKS